TAGTGAFTAIQSDSTAPYDAAWTPPAAGDYELRIRVTDAAGNTATGSAVAVTYASATRNVALAEPGSPLRGTVTLAATMGSAVARAVFEVSPAGAGRWTTLATDTTSPWAASFDTTTLDDGLYDLRV